MADAHVRPAREHDASEIGRIQAATWRVAYGNVISAEDLQAITPDAATAAWREAIVAPPSSAYQVFTAYERTTEAETTVGFAAIAPAAPDEDDLDAGAVELLAVVVEPRWGRRGHGSRLVSAAVSHAQRSEASTMICWILDTDKATESFLKSAGWQRDGWTRTLETARNPLHQNRLVADIT